MAELKQTPLYPVHEKYGARIVEFGGWAMPVQYDSILEEHKAVRTGAGLFDVSHMGEFEFSGSGALDLVQQLITNDAAKLDVGKVLYSPMCYEQGTIVDDVLVTRMAPERYLMVVNAGNIEKDWDWVQQSAARYPTAKVRNLSDSMALLALQGPTAEAILQPLTDQSLADLGYYWCRSGAAVAGIRTIAVSRTGYTGEDGFEIFCRPDDAMDLWDALLNPEDMDLAPLPCGLGARDTLRLEACLPLYGHEIDETTSPLEAGLGTFVKLNKGHFNGSEVLQAQKAAGLSRRLVGFVMQERGIPRQGHNLMQQGSIVGRVTSGSLAPTLDQYVGMGYVPVELADVGRDIVVDIRGKALRATIVKRPFYRRDGLRQNGAST